MAFHQLIFMALLFGSALFAFVRGGRPERIAAGLILAAAILSPLVQLPRGHGFTAPEVGIFAIDLILLLGLFLIAMVSTRFWPMAMVALQAPAPLSHIVALVQPGMLPRGYFAIEVFPSWAMLILLIVATARHRMRLRRYGHDPDALHDLPDAYRRGAPARPLPPRSDTSRDA